MRDFITRNQLIVFFALAFLLSWFPWYAGLGAEVLAIGPSLAAFVIVFLVNGRHGLVGLLQPFLRWRAGIGLWAIAVFGAAGLFLIGVAVHLGLGGDLPAFTMLRNELRLIPLYLVMVVLMPWNGPVGEEFGWRGFALPRLQAAYGPLAASLALGTIWGIWHLPALFAPMGVLAAMTAALGVGFILPYTLTTIANSIFMTWLFNKTHRSALFAGIVWHAASNFWAPIILSNSSLSAAGEGTELPTIEPGLYLAVTAVLVVAALLLVIATGGKLGYVGKD